MWQHQMDESLSETHAKTAGYAHEEDLEWRLAKIEQSLGSSVGDPVGALDEF
eukprot:SAG11_NODE_1385_length_5070_cov_3.950915_2_plen_52_part_00